MIRYGRSDCEHVWIYRKDGWEEECMPIICRKCGAFGCYCDAREKGFSCDDVKKEKLNGDANINGEWINPYVVKND
jgi:hypothetical protein